MNQQYPSKVVQSWTDTLLVVSGNHCRLIDNDTQKKVFQFNATSAAHVFVKNYSSFRYGRIA